MIDMLLWGFPDINDVRDEPVRPGACIERHAEQRASAAAVDFRHAEVEKLLDKCNMTWVGEIMVKSNHWLSMEEAVQLWLDSPGHRSIMLHHRAERVGIGRSHRGDTYVIVVNFGDKT